MAGWVLGNVYVAKDMLDKAIEAHERAGAIHQSGGELWAAHLQ